MADAGLTATAPAPPARRRFGLSILIALAAAALGLSPSLAFAQVPPRVLARVLAEDVNSRSDVRAFYAGRGFRSMWTEGDRPGRAADVMYRLASTAQLDGLSRAALRVDELADALRRAEGGDPRQLARTELALSRTLAAYVQGTRTPRQVGMSYQSALLVPVVPTPGAALRAATAAPSLERYLFEMQWMHPLYAELRRQLAAGQLDRARFQLVQLNLERARAIPANPAARYVLIDAAGARLFMYENGRVVDTMRVVVGKPTQQTPMIAGLLSSAILNPYWNVPPDLVRDRVAAGVRKEGLRYLRTGGYQVLSDFSDTPEVLDPTTVDWKAVAAGTTEIRVRQLPGNVNFMGKMKINFPNELGIYLHDTPDKGLLKEDVRQASSGCVRLEDASRLGRWLFGRTLDPTPGAVEEVVPLDQPVPVYITYLTTALENGELVFRDDNYRRDPPLLAALQAAPRSPR